MTAEHTGLRGADWRFLLPEAPRGTFDHLVLLGSRAGLGERIVNLGLAHRVSCRLPAERSADAVVILHDARPPLDQAARLLAPGGVLYLEVDRRAQRTFAATPARTSRLLRAAGLRIVGTYWAVPDFATRQMYLPLDARGALGWYLRTLFSASSLRRRLIELVLRRVAGADGRRFAPFVPCYALIAIAEREREPHALPEGVPAVLKGLGRPDLRPLVLTGGQDDLKRIVMLPFTSKGTRPVAVLKLSRLPRFNGDTVGEQAVLSRVHQSLDVSLQRTLPRPLGLFRYGSHAVGIESCAAGRSLTATSSRWRAPLPAKLEDLRLVARWLAEFHRQSELRRLSWGQETAEHWIGRSLADYRRTFGTSPAEERLFAAVSRRSRALRDESMPLVWQHHNFGAWNIFRAGQEINVIDWEHGRVGLPLYDLLHFVTHWIYTARGRRGDAGALHDFRELFCEPEACDPIVKAVHAAITEYMACLGLDHGFLPLLLVYMCVEKALTYFEGQQAFGTAGTNSRAGNRSVDYVAILAEHTDQLFSERPREQ